MATAGTPESARPVRARSPISAGQVSANAAASVVAAAADSEAVITVFRPRASERAPAPNIATASIPIAADSDRLAAAGDSENVRAKAGISGWTQ